MSRRDDILAQIEGLTEQMKALTDGLVEQSREKEEWVAAQKAKHPHLFAPKEEEE